jgi:hypothetical protein
MIDSAASSMMAAAGAGFGDEGGAAARRLDDLGVCANCHAAVRVAVAKVDLLSKASTRTALFSMKLP